MHNDFNPHGGQDGARDRTRRAPDAQPLADREVPLARKGMAADVHAWLDGELSEDALRESGRASEIEFWSRVNAEGEQRRSLRTPEHVKAQIMAALPETAPFAPAPWYRREVIMTQGTALIVAGAVVAATVAITTAVLATR